MNFRRQGKVRLPLPNPVPLAMPGALNQRRGGWPMGINLNSPVLRAEEAEVSEGGVLERERAYRSLRDLAGC